VQTRPYVEYKQVVLGADSYVYAIQLVVVMISI